MGVRVVVEKRRPFLKTVAVLVITALVVVGAWSVYHFARDDVAGELASSQTKASDLRKEKRALRREAAELRRQVDSLREEVVFLEKTVEIERQACVAVQDSLEGLQADASSLREQLTFYQGIVSPKDARTGLRMHEFRIRDTGVPHIYQYEIVLIQAGRHDSRARGTMTVEISGIESESSVAYSLGDVALGEATSMKFGFRYFQEFSGEFRLPEGFSPLRVMVRMKRVGSRAGDIKRTFDWSQVHELGSA